MLNLVKMMPEETHGNGIPVQLSVLTLKKHIPESQGGWNEGSTRGIGGKVVEDLTFGLPLDEWRG